MVARDKIPVNKGKRIVFAKISERDFGLLSGFKWYLNTAGYAQTTIIIGGWRSQAVMHRMVVSSHGRIVDHINQDRLDNRQENLRLTDARGNAVNRKKRADSCWRFKGVRKRNSKSKPWNAKLHHKGKYYGLGNFATEEEAARAYDRGAIKIFGEMAKLNFDRSDYVN